MKSIIQIFFLFNMVIAYGQDHVTATEKEVTMDDQRLTAWEININHCADNVKKTFSRYSKENLDVKVKSDGKNMMMAEKVNIPVITDKTGDLRAMMYNDETGDKLAVGFTLGYDLSLNSENYPAEMARLKEFVRKYGVYHETIYFQDVLDANEKRLDDLMKELRKSENEIKGLSNDIDKNDKKMRKGDDSNQSFDLNNENIEKRSRIQALNNIVLNLNEEIAKVSFEVEEAKGSLQKLQSQTYVGQ